MIEFEGKIVNQPISIFIVSGTSQSYISPNLVEIFHLKKVSMINHECFSWILQQKGILMS